MFQGIASNDQEFLEETDKLKMLTEQLKLELNKNQFNINENQLSLVSKGLERYDEFNQDLWPEDWL